jgi:hypothetical protein
MVNVHNYNPRNPRDDNFKWGFGQSLRVGWLLTVSGWIKKQGIIQPKGSFLGSKDVRTLGGEEIYMLCLD